MILAGRREAQLLESSGGHANALAVTFDVTDPRDVERLFAAAVRHWGRVDVLFNNAGVAHSPRPRTVAYTVTKHALTGLTKSIDLDGRGFGITCGQIDIGNTATELMDHIGVGSGAVQADGSRKVKPTFPVEEAARAVLLMARVPASASVGSLTLTAAGMPFIGRG